MSDCPHDSLSGDEDPVVDLGRWPTRWRCDECGALVEDSGPPATPVDAARTLGEVDLRADPDADHAGAVVDTGPDELLRRANDAMRCFGPGTTDGGRAEAGWLPAGRIVGAGPDIAPEPTVDVWEAWGGDGVGP